MHIRSRTPVYLVVMITLLLGFLVLFEFSPEFKRLICNAEIPVDRTGEANWKIAETNINSTITWQKGPITSHTDPYADSPRNSVTANDRVVAQKQEIVNDEPFPCNTSRTELIAYAATTGQEIWRSNPHYATTTLYPLKDSFLIIDNTMARKIRSNDGTEIWQLPATALPLRSIYHVYEDTNAIYLVSHLGLHKLDSETGNLINTIAADNIFAFLGDYRIDLNDRGQFEIVQFANDQSGKRFLTTPISRIPEEVGRNWPVITREGDFLALSFGERNVEVYRLGTGESLWQLTNILSPPVFLNGMMIVCNENVINIYDLESGTEIGIIKLSRSDENSVFSDYSSTCSTTYPNKVFIKFQASGEIVALEIEI